MRGATGNVPLVRIGGFISIHAPRAGCDFLATLQAPGKRISIHAPRAGCDNPYKVVTLWDNDFNPRTPCGVRRYKAAFVWRRENFNPRTPCGVRLSCLLPRAIRAEISIHAPRAGCDLPTELTFLRLYHFNPRTPCGVRRYYRYLTHKDNPISIHAPRAGCDGKFDGFTRPNLRKRYKKVSVQPKKRAKKKIKEMLCSHSQMLCSHSHIFGWISGAKVPEFPAR